MRLAIVPVLLAAVGGSLSSPAEAGAWAQAEGQSFVINQGGYGFGDAGEGHAVADLYAELGLGAGLTVVAKGDMDSGRPGEAPAWRAGGGVRYTIDLEALDAWLLSAEGSLRYQGEDMGGDPAYAGGGLGYGVRIDGGRAVAMWGYSGFVNAAAGYDWRPDAPAELRAELVAGLDLDEDWQVSAGYFGTWADGRSERPGAYEKHEAEMTLRWRLDEDYAVAVSVWRTVAARRTPEETTVRLALWTFSPFDEADGAG